MSSGPTCPKCGIAVQPGYVRCPKCRSPLPRRAQTVSPGGTAVDSQPFPVIPVAVAGGALLLVIILYFAFRSGKSEPPPPPPGPTATTEPAPAPTATPAPSGPTLAPTPAPTARGPSPDAVAADLERALRRKHLWSTVTVSGTRLDVRSSSCADPGMTAEIASAAGAGKAAGLVRLRCLEESGTVVMERDL